AALGQRHRVRVNSANVSHFHTVRNDQVVNDPDVHLADYREVVLNHQVVVLMDRTGQAVFNWSDAASGLFTRDRFEHLVKFSERNRPGRCAEQLAGRFLAERAVVPLKRSGYTWFDSFLHNSPWLKFEAARLKPVR